MNINKFVSNEEKLLTNKLTNPKHIALCFDRNHAIGAGVLITSIIANNTDLNFHFHLFALSIDGDDKRRFKKINGKAEITLYHVDSAFNDIEYASKGGYYPNSANIKLIAPALLKDKTDRVLYLDCDMLCTGKLSKLFEMDISNYVAACVLDVDDLRKDYSKNISLPNNNYFNSGMLYINTKKWCEEKVTEQTLALIGKNCYELPDQDALNTMLNTKYLIASDKFNYLSRIDDVEYISYLGNTNINEVAIFHFVGDKKPWIKIYMNNRYLEYFKISPWSNKKIKLSPNPSAIRIFSKYLMKEKHYISSIKYYCMYLLSKLRIINSL